MHPAPRFLTLLVASSVAIAAAADTGKKPTIALLTLKNTSGVETGEAEVISDRLRNELFGTGIVDVMEREQMQAILKEQGFQQSGACTDEGCMVEIGQLLGVGRIITGSIGKLGKIFMINLRAVDVATGKLSRVVSRDIKGDIEDLVEILPGIAREIVGDDSPPVRAPQAAPPPKEEPRETPRPPAKGAEVYFERFTPPAAIVKFALAESDLATINSALQSALDEALDPDVRLATPAEIAAAASSRAPVVRIRLLSYSTKPAAMKQTQGTAEVMVELYNNAAAATPACTTRIKESGDRHWGDQTPFVNALTEIAATIEDDLEDEDCVEKFNDSR